MITYYLTLSQVFPSTHPRAGEPTNFESAIKNAQMCAKCRKTPNMCMEECMDGFLKRHTMRANYEYWRKRFEKIDAGEACLSIRQWVGKPYGKGSTQRELMRLTREDGIGIQKLCFPNRSNAFIDFPEKRIYIPFEVLANNDGLLLEDWCNWFRHYDLSKPMAIIHFTNYRY